jgi:hypothetical protein
LADVPLNNELLLNIHIYKLESIDPNVSKNLEDKGRNKK